MILLWWRAGGAPPPPPAPKPGGGPKPPPRRRYVYDVFHGGKVVRKKATQTTIETPAPKAAVRVVVENPPSEPKARQAARAVAKTYREEAAKAAFRHLATERIEQEIVAQTGVAKTEVERIVRIQSGQQIVSAYVAAAEAQALREATEDQLVISILMELGELDG